jgi:hypothetical protein
MAGKLTVVGAGIALDGMSGRTNITARNLYLALLTAPASVTTTPATMTEYAATGYSRQLCAMGTPSGTPRVIANTAGLSYGPLTGANGTTAVTYWALVSTASGTTGECVAFGDMVTPRTPAASDTLTAAIGSITVSID